jgi:hypothetical protein
VFDGPSATSQRNCGTCARSSLNEQVMRETS